MDKIQPLLSICIPTYNRSNFLDLCLKNITAQETFDQRVEVVISDNCSTDNTKDIVSKYQLLHNNIFYYCNENNIYDENFTKALSLGRGEYLKLVNDTILFKPGVLEHFLFYIERYIDKKPALFFYKNNERHANKNIICSDYNQFVDTASYFIGWLANFGAWKVHFKEIESKNRFSHMQFLQIDWSLRMFENKECVIIFNDWIESQPLNKKGGYNFFEVHIANYLFLYQQYLSNGSLSYNTFRREKNRLLHYFLSYWIYRILLLKDDTYYFETAGWRNIFWRNYKYYPLLYIVFCKQILKFIYNWMKDKTKIK